ncbi:hypothetical protein [Nocardia tengchongensis]|uniref:hypothetical protein n=1 Tax=Nocardia tengchongensis TaxID=2055889 RepID=UPI00367C1366
MLVPKHVRDEDFCEEHLRAFAYSCFPRSFRGLADPDHVFDFGDDESEFIGGRCYEVSGSETHSIEEAYTGYNQRRDQLSLLFLGVGAGAVAENPERYEDGPFFELINFADNEGCIGPEAAANLLADFEAGRATVESSAPDLLAWYDNWTTACRLAAGTGLIDFH